MTSTLARTTDWVALARELGPQFAERAAAYDADDRFVAENYAALKERGAFAAGVPAELGGGGASIHELSAMLRELAHYCSSTALAFAMHTHLVAVPAWRWRRENAPVEGFLRRVATEGLVLVSAGASDWVESSGTLTKAEGGYRFTGRKIFGSGSPAGDLLVTSGVYEDPALGTQVLHFAVPLRAEGVRVQDNWRTLGMRGTGSNDTVIEGAFVPDAAISVRRAIADWTPVHYAIKIALPLVFSAYVGVAEAARELAVSAAMRRKDVPDVQIAIGEMDSALRGAQIALASALDFSENAPISFETSNEVLMRRQMVGQGVLRSVEKAMEVAGGASFFRATGLERLWRDVQGARFHPLPEKAQYRFAGRMALGLEPEPR